MAPQDRDLTGDEVRRILDILAGVQWHDTGEDLMCNYCWRHISYDHGATRPAWLPDCGLFGPCQKPSLL